MPSTQRDRVEVVCCCSPALFRMIPVNNPPPEGGGYGNGLKVLFRPKAGSMVPAPSGLQEVDGLLFDLFDRLRRDGFDHEMEVLQEGLSSGVPEDHPLARLLGRTIKSVTGSLPAFEMCPGLLETRFYAQRGIPAMAYGPGLLSVSHSPNEFVPVKNIRDCAAVYALLAAEALTEWFAVTFAASAPYNSP